MLDKKICQLTVERLKEVERGLVIVSSHVWIRFAWNSTKHVSLIICQGNYRQSTSSVQNLNIASPAFFERPP